MPRNALLGFLLLILAGCGTSAASPTAVVTSTAVPSNQQTTTTKTPPPRATATVALSPAYMSFVRTLCRGMSAGNASVVTGRLMHYQYNSGLRWGMLGDGEGQTADPSTMTTWLSGSHVQCRSFSPNVAGHGTLLTSGWAQPAAWSLLDLDLLNGQWVINDFTFSTGPALARAMHGVNHPILTYRG